MKFEHIKLEKVFHLPKSDMNPEGCENNRIPLNYGKVSCLLNNKRFYPMLTNIAGTHRCAQGKKEVA